MQISLRILNPLNPNISVNAGLVDFSYSAGRIRNVAPSRSNLHGQTVHGHGHNKNELLS